MYCLLNTDHRITPPGIDNKQCFLHKHTSAAATAAKREKKVLKGANNDLDVDIVVKAVDDVVHLGAPVVTPGLELLVLLRPTRATNQQKRSKTVGTERKDKAE